MDNKLISFGPHSQLRNVLLAGVAICLLGSATAKASLILEVQSVNATAGSSGNTFDVDLLNTGTSSVTVGGFAFGLSTANPVISFRDASTATAEEYIFGSNSLFGPDLTGPINGQSLLASDAYKVPSSGVNLSSGETVGLGQISFDVSSTAAAGKYPVIFAAFPTSSLSDQAGNDLLIGSLSNGDITIGGHVVPEPSMLLPFGAGILLVGACRRGRSSPTRSASVIR